MTGWQPIESAPKDGTEILAYSASGCTGVMLVRHIALCDFLTDKETEGLSRKGMSDEGLETPDWFAADFVAGARLSPDCHPTHWQPLPEPPTMIKSQPYGAYEGGAKVLAAVKEVLENGGSIDKAVANGEAALRDLLPRLSDADPGIPVYRLKEPFDT